MNNTGKFNIIDKLIDSFYKDRKLSLRYTKVGDLEALFDHKVAFLGSLTDNKKEPADGKSIVFIWERLSTIAL